MSGDVNDGGAHFASCSQMSQLQRRVLAMSHQSLYARVKALRGVGHEPANVGRAPSGIGLGGMGEHALIIVNQTD
jgi:hypothetical protein